MGLKDSLQEHRVPLPPDFDERMDLLVAALRKSSTYKDKLAAFKKQRGGVASTELNPEDWLGPHLNWFVDGVTSPFARVVWLALFSVVFFIKYIEATPVFGSVVSVVLDLMLVQGKVLTKTIQRALPVTFGMIPWPAASIFGMVLAGLFGLLMWPIIGLIAFSRGEFSTAVESYFRAIPPPIGDMLADMFLDVNRTAAGLNMNRVKLVKDLSSAFLLLEDSVGGIADVVKEGLKGAQEKASQATMVSNRLKEGFSTLKDKVQEQVNPDALAGKFNNTLSSLKDKVQEQVNPDTLAGKFNNTLSSLKDKVALPVRGGIRFSRRKRTTKKWRMHRTRRSMPSKSVRR